MNIAPVSNQELLSQTPKQKIGRNDEKTPSITSSSEKNQSQDQYKKSDIKKGFGKAFAGLILGGTGSMITSGVVAGSLLTQLAHPSKLSKVPLATAGVALLGGALGGVTAAVVANVTDNKTTGSLVGAGVGAASGALAMALKRPTVLTVTFGAVVGGVAGLTGGWTGALLSSQE